MRYLTTGREWEKGEWKWTHEPYVAICCFVGFFLYHEAQAHIKTIWVTKKHSSTCVQGLEIFQSDHLVWGQTLKMLPLLKSHGSRYSLVYRVSWTHK